MRNYLVKFLYIFYSMTSLIHYFHRQKKEINTVARTNSKIKWKRKVSSFLNMPSNVRSGVLTLLHTACGAGVLAMPFAFKPFGLMPGLITLTFCGICSLCGLLLPVSYTHLDVYKRQPRVSRSKRQWQIYGKIFSGRLHARVS